MPTENTAPAIIDANDPTAVLVAWLGQTRTPEGAWPSDDREAFRAALVAHALTDSGMSLVDDRESPMSPDDDDYHQSLAAYADGLVIQERAYL